MKWRNTLILLVTLAALATYTYFGDLQKGTGQATETPNSELAIFNLSGQDILGLKVTTADSKSVELKREAGQPWAMVSPASQGVDETRVNSLVDQLARLTASRALTQTNNLAEYGLITGTLTANITLTGGVTHTLLVGETNPGGSSYYALADGKQTPVYLIYSSDVDGLQRLVTQPPYPPTPMPTTLPSPTVEILPPITVTTTVTGTVPAIEVVPTLVPAATPTGTPASQ
jgi:Domain of unknown function (DUF4340)